MGTKALSVVVATIVALSMVDMAAAVPFDWWNTSWHYRANVTINTSVYNRTDWPIEQGINFTALGVAGAFDNNSVRVIEYNGTTGAAMSEITSQFDEGQGYNKGTNAYGEVIWLLNGTIPNNTMLYYYIYFDSEDEGPKPSPGYASTLVFYNFTQGGSANFGLNNSKIGIRVDTERGANYTSGMYFANASGTVIFDSSASQDPIEYIRYYSNPNYYGYDFKDSFDVVSDGPVRIRVRQTGDEKVWGTAATLTNEGTMTKTYTIYKNSQWITINQTFTSAAPSVERTSDSINGIEALAIDLDRTNINPSAPDYSENTTDPYSWASVARNVPPSMGIGVINLDESTSAQDKYRADSDFNKYDIGIDLKDPVTLDTGESVSQLAAVYFNNVTSHDPVKALRNRMKDNVAITMGPGEERRTVVQAQTDYGIYNRNETIDITGNVTLDTHNLSDHANATITDPTGANTSINLTKSGSLFLGNYTLPLDAITGVWDLTVRVYEENDYLLNTSMTTFNVTDVYIVDIQVLNSPALVNQTMLANVSVRTFRNDTGIQGANLSCAYDYNGTTNVTNVTDNGFGDYSINWTAPQEGTWNLTCNATKYNNTGTGNATFVTTVKDTTLLSMELVTTQYNVSGVTQTANQTFTARFNVTNLEQGYAYAVNVTLDTGSWPVNITNPYTSCGDMGPYESCIVDFEVTVPEKTAPGMYNMTANVTWENFDFTKNSSLDWKNITVDSNPLLEIIQSSLNGTFAENSVGLLGNFTVNSTGNDDLGLVDFTCISGEVCSNFSTVFTPASIGSLAAGSWTNISVNITIPDGYSPGSYSGTVNASYAGLWDTVLLNVTVLESKNWSYANVSSCDKTAIPNDTGSICEFEINNTGNVPLNFTITPVATIMSPENYTYSNVTSFSVPGNATYRIFFRYNTTNATNQTISTTYTINATDPGAVPDDANLTVTLKIVLGPDIQFNITHAKLQQLDTVTINAIIIDRLGDGISWVNANITWPDGTVDTVNLTNVTIVIPGGTSNWSFNYTSTTLRGNYSVMVFSWDDGGGYGESTEKNFTVYAKLVIDIYPYPLSITQGTKGRFYIYVNDSNNAQLLNANVTVDITVNPLGPYYDWGPYSYLTDSGGYASSTPYEILDNDPTGQWDWNATVTYYDSIGDENITKNVSGQFSVIPEGASYTVSISAGDQYYPGDNVTIIATTYESGNLIAVDNVTVNITDDIGNEIKAWNLTLIPGPAYKGTLELPGNFTPGSYFAKAIMYESAILPDKPSNIDFFEVLPYTPQLILEVTVEDIYKPGDLVSITAFVNDENNQYLPDANVTVKITDPNGTAIDLNMTAVNTTTPPKYIANYTLLNNASLGPYIVFGEVTYDLGYASDVDLFAVSESLYAKVGIGPVVYLNSTMDIKITVLNPITGQGIDPDEITLSLYITENNTLQLWKNMTKADFTAGDPGLYNYSETVNSNTSTGSYIALLEIKEGSYRAWGMETFRIETGLFYDVLILSATDPLTKGSNLEYTVNITNMGEFLSEDVLVTYWIDDGTVYSASEPRAILPTGQSDVYLKSFSSVNLPAGTHILYVSVSYDDVVIATASKTFQIVDGGASPGGGGGGGGAPSPPEAKGIPKLSIIEFYPPEVHVERGGVTYLVVTVENLGGADLYNVSAHIKGIPVEWFELIKGEAMVLASGESSDLLLQITIPENVTAQTVTLTVVATSNEMSHEKSILMMIFSSRYDLVYFEVESVKKTLRNSEDRAFRALKDSKNVSMVMGKLDEARVEIRQAGSFLKNDEYTKALGRLDNAREILEQVNELLELARVEEVAVPVPTETPAPERGISTPALVFMFLLIAVLAGAVVYLTRDRISSALKTGGVSTLKRPKIKRINPEAMAKSVQLKEDIRRVERLLETMKDQHEKGLISDSTYQELKKRNDAKIKEITSQLKKLGA